MPELQFHGGYDGLEPRPMRPREKPRAGEEYQDEAFGTRVTRISHAVPIDGENAIIKTLYSTVPAWSADERYLLLWSRAHGHLLYQGDRPYRYLGPLGAFHPTDIESVLWSSRVDCDFGSGRPIYEFVYPTNYDAQPILYRHLIYPTRVEPLKDFRRAPLFLTGGDWAKLLSLGGDPQWMSRDQRIIGLRFGPTSGAENALTFTYSVDEDHIGGKCDLDPIYANALVPSPSGYYMQFGRVVMSAEEGTVLHMMGMKNPYEHASPGMSERGDTWNTVDFDSRPERKGTLVVYQLSTGEARVIIGPDRGYPYPPSGTHLSAIGPEGLVAVGIVGSGQGQTLLDNEIVLADVNTGRVLRIAHARTLADEGPWGYWSETHVTISPSGTRVLFTSDWGGSDTVDTYVVDLRTERPDELAEEPAPDLPDQQCDARTYTDPRSLVSCTRAPWPSVPTSQDGSEPT